MIPGDWIVDNFTDKDYEDYMGPDLKAWAAETVSELALRTDYEARVLHLLARVTGLLRELIQENAELRQRIADLHDEARNPPTLRTVRLDKWAGATDIDTRFGPNESLIPQEPKP